MTVEIDFSPVSFLRCHSKNKDSADVQTQVWQCAFEPHDDNSDSTVVATCGGNSVCFIDCSKGTVISKYYSQSLKELFFSLAWTTFSDGKKLMNLLVAGGALSTLHFISRSINQVLLVEPLNLRTKTTVHSLFFHPSFKDTLFCGVSNGEIRILRVKYLPSDVKVTVDHCSILRTDSEIFDLTICTKLSALFSSCDAGLFSFKLEEKPFNTKVRTPLKVILPRNPNPSLKGSTSLVDSIEVLKEDVIAVKCALHGRIYICQLSKGGFKAALDKGLSSVNVTPLTSLIWSDTDNYFMYMSFSKGANLLSCGDDKGNVWLYDLGRVLKSPPKEDVDPVKILPWPQLTDHHNDKKRKLKLDVYDIVVDKVALHSSALYIVAVTNNNMVCVWKRN